MDRGDAFYAADTSRGEQAFTKVMVYYCKGGLSAYNAVRRRGYYVMVSDIEREVGPVFTSEKFMLSDRVFRTLVEGVVRYSDKRLAAISLAVQPKVEALAERWRVRDLAGILAVLREALAAAGISLPTTPDGKAAAAA